MTTATPPLPPRLSAILAAYYLVCLGILYGSLFPFHFRVDWPARGFAGFLASWRDVNSISDILGNVALFIPYGYLACLLALRWAGALRLAVAGVALALLCQLAQLFTPLRDPSIADLYLNLLGGALGWCLARLLPLGSGAAPGATAGAHPLPLLLCGCWLASLLLPFLPAVDMHAWREALAPLLYPRRWSWPAWLVATASWLVFYHLLACRAQLRLRLPVVLGGVTLLLGLKVLILQNRLTPEAVLAAVAAIPLWYRVGRRLRGRTLALLLFAAFCIDGLAPLSARAAPRDFGWLPFVGYLQGSMLVNAVALCRKLFVFGALALLLLPALERPQRGALLLAACLALLEVAQRYIGHGTPALTDPLLFLVLAWLLTLPSRGALHG
ncbi:MAG: hypothetical protein CME59_03305 [Halioglobus sp.]|nr:hypothetical protein [Halioglobus sp.]|tara:strand:- start:2819 stop:3970 length:1152 start_codon:yes stop_codon:yes gene_type:complete